MQLMTWPLARFGSRFGLLFEPHKKQVMHSALGRFFDQPMELVVGLVEQDGSRRVLPFTKDHEVLYACEQYERVNSITFRGNSEHLGLRFELNVHSPFYPQNEDICAIPAFYFELRVVWVERLRQRFGTTEPVDKVRLFFMIKRPHTEINAAPGRIDMAYKVPLCPALDRDPEQLEDIKFRHQGMGQASVRERIASINEGAEPIEVDGARGLTLELPVSEEGLGIKWRLVWGAYTNDEVFRVQGQPGRFRYVMEHPSLESVMKMATENRSVYLQMSRRFEKLLEQAPLGRPKWHLTTLGFQSFLSNTFWCTLKDGTEWFSTSEGASLYQSAVDVEYNQSLFYLAVWPRLLNLILNQWTSFAKEHGPSGGLILSHDIGQGLDVSGQIHPDQMPIEENSNFLLLLQAYVHWTGDKQPLRDHQAFIRKLADYLVWTDVDHSGFPSEGTVSTMDDGSMLVQLARKHTYLAIKRVAALEAVADLLGLIDPSSGLSYNLEAAKAVSLIERTSWLGDHYAVTVDHHRSSITGVFDPQGSLAAATPGWDAYSIYTANGLLLPALTGQPQAFDHNKLVKDSLNSIRETLTPYGCALTSHEKSNVWISQNLWRDLTAAYFRVPMSDLTGRYWDMLIFSNVGDQSLGFVDTYIGKEQSFDPRGATAFGYFLSGPRLTIDRLGIAHIAVRPDRHKPQRWPLLPLADWESGKFPVLVVDENGVCYIESEISPVVIKGDTPEGMIG